MPEYIQCHLVTSGDILPLRARELRSNKPVESARFPEDELESTLHFGAYFQNTAIGCLTLIETAGTEIPTWQLRGMATDRVWKRKRVGRTLLLFAESYLSARYPELKIWCNARINAVPFYLFMGYVVSSGVFHIEHIGLHYKMEKHFV